MGKKSTTFITLKANDRLAFLLDECDNGENFSYLNSSKFEEVWQIIKTLLNDNIGNSEEAGRLIVKECLSLAHTAVKSDIALAGPCITFVAILRTINEKAIELPDVEARNQVCKINELWLAEDDAPQVRGMDIFTLRHLICLCLIDKPSAIDLKRLAGFRKHVTVQLLETTSSGFRPLLNKLVQHPIVIGTEVSRKFLAFVASRCKGLMQDIHRSIALELSNCKKKTAENYGKIYILAWMDADEEVKRTVEGCMQSHMEEFMKHRRTGLELPKRYANLLLAIDTWNVEVRKKSNIAFISAICDCYRPILWKYLQSGYNAQRCSAVDLFFKAFPLQNPADADVDLELSEMQYNSIVAALNDDCHIVRIIAIREICNILPMYWAYFKPTQIQALMTNLTKVQAADLSSPESRRMVWRGFLNFLSSDLPYNYLKQILPTLKDKVHEINQRVRVAFLLLLIAIRDKKDPEFKYTDVVPIPTLFNRLAEEKLIVGQHIVKLTLPTFYASHMELKDWIKRFVYLIKTFPHSYRNFFMFSKKSLPFQQAHTIMCGLLSYMGGYVKEKLAEAEEDNSENDANLSNCARQTRVRRKRKASRASTDSDSSVSSSRPPQNCAFEDPTVVTGLFDIITILWVVNEAHLNDPEYQTECIQLRDTYIQFAQPFINYYKDSLLFNSIITMSGNVPASILQANSITLPGYCMKMVKSMEMSEDARETACNQTMLNALIKWGRGSVVLEQVGLWIEAAFESSFTRSNESLLAGTKRVKIHETIQPNSLVAVYILDTIMRTELMKLTILKKNYDQLLELWKTMGKIKEYIYRRLLRGQPYKEPLLSDQFLISCFIRYVKLIPLLQPVKPPNKPDELADEEDELEERMEEDEDDTGKFNAAAELFALVSWTQDDILPLLQAEECPNMEFLASIINNVLYVADNMITLRMVDRVGWSQVGQLVISSLSLDHNLHFVRSATRVTASISFWAKAKNDETDEDRVFATTVPSLLFHTVNALISRPHDIETIEHFKEDLGTVKTNIGKILAAYEHSFSVTKPPKERADQVKLIMSKIIQAIRVVMSPDIPSPDFTVKVYKNVSQLTPIPSVLVNTVYNKKFWTPLFLLTLREQLGRSVKNLLIDIIILDLLSKAEGNKFNDSIEIVLQLVTARLKEFQRRRESGAIKSLGLTLCEAQDKNEDEEDEDMEEDPTCPTQPTVSTQITGLSAAVSRGLSEQLCSLASNGSTQRTEDIFSGLTAPSSQPSGFSQISGERLTGTSVPSSQETGLPLSGLATINSDSQPPTIGAIGVEPSEDDLIDDFINLGFSLLNNIKEAITVKPPATAAAAAAPPPPRESSVSQQ